jgi:hypothetical protein
MSSHTTGAGLLTSKVPREIAALISALQLREPDATSLERLEDYEWKSLLAFCDLAHLTLSLAQLPQDGFPSWVVERLTTNAADNALRFERVKATYREAAEALDRAGVEHVVIKGFTQAPDYVKDPRARVQSDLDLYCPVEMIEAAQIALGSIGYKANKDIDYSRTDHVPTMVRPGNWKWRGNPFDPEMPLSIELHFCLWNGAVALFHIPKIEGFWERRTTRVIDGLSFPSLSPVDHLGHLTLHILRNIILGEWIIHHVYELAVFLQSHSEDDAFWKIWAETHGPSLRSIEAISLYYARAWFGCDLHPQAEDALASIPPLQQRWLCTFARSSLEGMFHHNKDFLWLHLSFLKSPKTKLALFKRTLIPPRIAPIDSPMVKVKNKRLRRTSESHRYWQYLVYLADRSVSHSIASLSTLRRGLQWRLSQHQLVRQFWIFLAASFFLT